MGHHDIELLLKQAQALAKDIQELESIDVAKGYGYTRQRIAQRKRQTLQTRLMRYVAFLSLPLLLTSLTLGYLLLTQSADEEHLVEVKASQGSVIRYELPDGSVVWLNAGSSLSHPAHFIHKERRVTLHGEAYFEVQADKDSPFYVQTSRGIEVYVYGTRFNVSTYEDDSQVSTLLEEGHLCVNLPNDTTPYELRPGECFDYTPSTGAHSRAMVDVYERTAWKEGKLIFRNATLETIFKRIERHFNIDIEFHNHSGKEHRYRATFRNETLSQILEYLSQSTPLKWEKQNIDQPTDDTPDTEKIIIHMY